MIVRPRFIWGRGDTSVFPKIAEAVKAGKFRWIGGGRYLTSTCHVRSQWRSSAATRCSKFDDDIT